jgi:hypothetical protein
MSPLKKKEKPSKDKDKDQAEKEVFICKACHKPPSGTTNNPRNFTMAGFKFEFGYYVVGRFRLPYTHTTPKNDHVQRKKDNCISEFDVL